LRLGGVENRWSNLEGYLIGGIDAVQKTIKRVRQTSYLILGLSRGTGERKKKYNKVTVGQSMAKAGGPN